MAQQGFIEALAQEAALPSTFARARQIVRSGGVLSCESDTGATGGVACASGLVRGSQGARYRARVEFDLEDAEVIDYSCTCPAADRYDGMCKHAIALGLRYLDGAGLARIDAALPARPVSSPERRRAQVQPTSAPILQVLDTMKRRRVNGIAAARGVSPSRARPSRAAAGPVSFEVTIGRRPGFGASAPEPWWLRLRAAAGGVSYLVRDIDAVLDAWSVGAPHGYGARLSVVHVPESFDDRAAALLDALASVRRSGPVGTAGRAPSSAHGPAGAVPLSASALCAVLDVLQGARIRCESTFGGARRIEEELEVVQGAKLPTARVVAAEQGFELEFEPFDLVWGGSSAYLLGASRAARLDAVPARGIERFRALWDAGAPLHVAEANAADLARVLVPELRGSFEVEVPGELERKVPEARFVFTVAEDDGDVVCRAQVAYGERSYDLFAAEDGGPADAPGRGWVEPARPPLPSAFPFARGASPRSVLAPERGERDEYAEYRAVQAVEEFFPEGFPQPKFSWDDDERLYRLLTEGLRELRALGEVLLSDRLRTVSARPAPKLAVRATVRSGLLDVELGASGMKPAELAAYLASYRRRQRFVRLTDGEIVRIDGSAREAEALAEALGVRAEDLVEGARGLPPSRAMVVDALLDRMEEGSAERSPGFRDLVGAFDALTEADLSVPATLGAELRGYQLDGFRWLGALERMGCGGILADDMGLGKTLQMIAHILAGAEAVGEGEGAEAAGEGGGSGQAGEGEGAGPAGAARTTLVVCPASLVYNWMAELGRFAPTLRAVALTGAAASRREAIARCGECDVVVTSYDLMKRDIEELAGREFARIVLDEAQYIKNPGTQAARCAKLLRAPARFALTGTPVENRLSDLWSIFDFLMPGLLGSRDAFARRYQGPVEAGEEGAAARLRRITAPFVLRRLKADVLADLPEKSESVVLAHLSGEQGRLYRANEERLALQVAHEAPSEFGRKKLQVLAELTKLRQICCDPRLFYEGYRGPSAKLETCLELVRTAVDGGHRVLVFSQFVSMLEIIGERLRAERVSFEQLDGSCTKEARSRLVERFQAGGTSVLLISLKAGGVGLNLTAADVVIHFDPWWNVAAQDQATDRAHRIGQTREVSVFKLIAQGTVEERILAMQEGKRELVESVIGGGSPAGLLTREDFLALLGEARG